jgi:hypothetical protein
MAKTQLPKSKLEKLEAFKESVDKFSGEAKEAYNDPDFKIHRLMLNAAYKNSTLVSARLAYAIRLELKKKEDQTNG